MNKKSFNLSKFITNITGQNPLDQFCDDKFISNADCSIMRLTDAISSIEIIIQNNYMPLKEERLIMKKVGLMNAIVHEMTFLIGQIDETIQDCNKRRVEKGLKSYSPSFAKLKSRNCNIDNKDKNNEVSISKIILKLLQSEFFDDLKKHHDGYSRAELSLKNWCQQIIGIK